MSGSDETKLQWHAPYEAPLQLAGFAWYETDKVYRRLPVSPSHPLPEAVDGLANNTAGGQIRFQTDSSRLSVRVELRGPASMNHMPSTGQCGFDCYLGEPKQQRYLNTTKYDHTKTEYECVLYDLPDSVMRNVTLNFPLYQGVNEVMVGLNEGAEILPPPPFEREGRVVVYGTSITQGGCACRPGMAYTNILSRRLNLEFINLGFSGSGRGEADVAQVVSQTPNPICFVLDYEANSGGGESLRESFPRFIRILREAHPTVTILAVSRISYAGDAVNAGMLQAGRENGEFQQGVVEECRAAGDESIFYHDGKLLLGDTFDECTVDGVHPNDLGFFRMAEGLAPVLAGLLGG